MLILIAILAWAYLGWIVYDDLTERMDTMNCIARERAKNNFELHLRIQYLEELSKIRPGFAIERHEKEEKDFREHYNMRKGN